MPLSWDLVIPAGIGILTPPTASSWEPLHPDAPMAQQSRQAASRSHLLISALIICLFSGSYISVLIRSNQIRPDSAVEGEAQDEAQAFRSERNGPVPLSAVAGIGAMSGVLNRGERSAE